MILTLLKLLAVFASSTFVVAVAREPRPGTPVRVDYYRNEQRSRVYWAGGELYGKQNVYSYREPIQENPGRPGGCGPNEFWCEAEKWCITYRLLCDGFPHCSDASDETGCPHSAYNEKSDPFEFASESRSGVTHAAATDASAAKPAAATDAPAAEPAAATEAPAAEPAPATDAPAAEPAAAASPEPICIHAHDKNCVIPFLFRYETKILNFTYARQDTFCFRNGKWRCRDGGCIDFQNICDRNVDCADGSDELWTLCEITQPISETVFVHPGLNPSSLNTLHGAKPVYILAREWFDPYAEVPDYEVREDAEDNGFEEVPENKEEEDVVDDLEEELPPTKSGIGSGLPGLPQLPSVKRPPSKPAKKPAALPALPTETGMGSGLPGLPQLPSVTRPPSKPAKKPAALPALPTETGIGSGLPGLPQLPSVTRPPSKPAKKPAALPALPTESGIGSGLPGLPQLPSVTRPPSKPAALPALPAATQPAAEVDDDDDDVVESDSAPVGASPGSASNSGRHCRLAPHVSVKYECEQTNKASRECNDLEPAGTRVFPKCAKYYYSPQEFVPMRCVDGAWDYIARCTTDCGRQRPPSLDDFYPPTPWHVVLYRKSTDSAQHQRICAGTLISNSVIISAARCFWSGSPLPASEFAASVGFKFYPWNATNNGSQTSDVQNIIIPPGFRGDELKYQDDIALVVVAEPFVWSDSVRPACIDFDQSFDGKQLQPKNSGEISRWKERGNASASVGTSSLQYAERAKCVADRSAYFTPDKICALDESGPAPAPAWCAEDVGAGLLFPDAERYEYRYYVRGVLSLALDKDGCSAMSVVTFTHVHAHRAFIQQYWSALRALDDSRSSVSKPKTGDSKCVLPQVPEHGSYVTSSSSVGNVSGSAGYELVTLNVTCRPGYGVQGPSSVKCFNGFWPDKIPQCIQLCQLVAHVSVEYRCLLSGAAVGSRDCREFEPPGTVVSPRCREPLYYSVAPLSFMRCKLDARWNYVATCKPDCGRATPRGSELAVGGDNAQHGELPWHVGIYDKLFTPYQQVCGGSLIANDLVISAAHCFWKGQQQLETTQFAAAAGKLYRPWNDAVDSAQKSDLKRIHIPSRFRGSDANFQDDVAVLVLSQPFVYRSFIRPVCLSFDANFDRLQLQTINKGKVAGWGLTGENGKASPTLQVLELPYVEVLTCIAESPLNFVQYITSDKICAGTRQPTTALCRGDSGGGLVFAAAGDSATRRYYLRGVVSTAATDDDNNACNTRTYTSFTHLQQHEDFILPYLNDF